MMSTFAIFLIKYSDGENCQVYGFLPPSHRQFIKKLTFFLVNFLSAIQHQFLIIYTSKTSKIRAKKLLGVKRLKNLISKTSPGK